MFSQSNLRALLSTEKMAGFLRKEFASLIRLQIYDIAIAVFEYFANFFYFFFAAFSHLVIWSFGHLHFGLVVEVGIKYILYIIYI